MPVRRPLALGITLALALGCGDATPPPPPAAAPEDFDDPFAASEASDEAPAPAEEPAPAELAAAEPATGSTGAAGEPAVPNDMSEKTDALAEAAPATEPAADEASPRAAATKGAKEPGATKAPAKAPTTPTPAPAEEPPPETPKAPADAPAPAPASEAPKPATPAREEPPPPPPQQRLAGTWTYVGGESQRTRLGEAIEAAVQQLNPVIRGIGRKRLTESNKIRESITITVDGDRVTTIFVAGRPVSGTLGGPAFDWTNDEGKTIKVRFTLVKGRLVQDFTDKDGARRNTFTVDASGDKLNLSVTISSDRLDTPMKYALSYRRK